MTFTHKTTPAMPIATSQEFFSLHGPMPLSSLLPHIERRAGGESHMIGRIERVEVHLIVADAHRDLSQGAEQFAMWPRL